MEAFEQHDVKEEAKRSIQDAGELARAAVEEGRTQGQTPEMQQVGGYLKTAGHATADAARSATGAVRSGVDTMRTGATHASDVVREKAHGAADTVRENVQSAKDAAYRFQEEVKVRAEAVGETGRRARVAPGRISHELRAALDSWKRGLLTSLALMLGVAVFATIMLIVLTIALVVGLNELVGDPAGTFLVALLYLVVAGIAYALARNARKKAQAETHRRLENSREEARNVVRPVRDAFGRGRAGI